MSSSIYRQIGHVFTVSFAEEMYLSSVALNNILTPMELIIVADDLGLSSKRDEGILQAAEATRISRASLLVNGLSSAVAAKKAVEIDLPLGLHFNCSEGLPVSKALNKSEYLVPFAESTVRASCAEQTPAPHCFPGKSAAWQMLSSCSKNTLEAIAEEFEHQTFRFHELVGYMPTHFDSHQHLHTHPALVSVIANRAKKLGFISVRCPWEKEVCQSQLFASEVSKLAIEARKVFKSVGLRTSDEFFGLSCTCEPFTVEKLENYIDSCDGESCEIMTHPGKSERSWDEFNASKCRDVELERLLSKEFGDALARHVVVSGIA